MNQQTLKNAATIARAADAIIKRHLNATDSAEVKAANMARHALTAAKRIAPVLEPRFRPVQPRRRANRQRAGDYTTHTLKPHQNA